MSKILNTSGEFYFAIFGEYSIATYRWMDNESFRKEFLEKRKDKEERRLRNNIERKRRLKESV